MTVSVRPDAGSNSHRITTSARRDPSVGYGVGTLIGAVRTARIAPVSREMILNYIAQHTLGLPKSY